MDEYKLFYGILGASIGGGLVYFLTKYLPEREDRIARKNAYYQAEFLKTLREAGIVEFK